MFKQIAIIGATASGKSDLALKFADKLGGDIFSIDSLSIYRYFDIVSAKPNRVELSKIKHFGIDVFEPYEHVSVQSFIELYKKVTLNRSKPLIIVGGSSFYLKSMLNGLSELPKIDLEIKNLVQEKLKNIDLAYKELQKIDLEYSKKIKSKDRYRIEKGLEIYYATKIPPTQYFQINKPKPIISNNIKIYNIDIDRKELHKKIEIRTKKMIQLGAIDEVANIIKRFGTDIQPAKAIGVKEIIKFLNGEIRTEEELIELITIHTRQYAKRQQTFNKTFNL